jgi:hypothetical protein
MTSLGLVIGAALGAAVVLYVTGVAPAELDAMGRLLLVFAAGLGAACGAIVTGDH